MQDICTLPFVCAATRSSIADWCGYILAVMRHPDLCQDQKYLWMWLTCHSANQSHHSCSFTYEQLSQAMDLPTKTIHSILFKLKLMGLLNGNIPVWYGTPTPEMNKEKRILRPILTSQKGFANQSMIKNLMEKQMGHLKCLSFLTFLHH